MTKKTAILFFWPRFWSQSSQSHSLLFPQFFHVPRNIFKNNFVCDILPLRKHSLERPLMFYLPTLYQMDEKYFQYYCKYYWGKAMCHGGREGKARMTQCIGCCEHVVLFTDTLRNELRLRRTKCEDILLVILSTPTFAVNIKGCPSKYLKGEPVHPSVWHTSESKASKPALGSPLSTF